MFNILWPNEQCWGYNQCVKKGNAREKKFPKNPTRTPLVKRPIFGCEQLVGKNLSYVGVLFFFSTTWRRKLKKLSYGIPAIWFAVVIVMNEKELLCNTRLCLNIYDQPDMRCVKCHWRHIYFPLLQRAVSYSVATCLQFRRHWSRI
jgi:hypothetical protein